MKRLPMSGKFGIGRIFPALSGACLLSLGITAGYAQDCNNASATPSVCAFDAAKHAAADTRLKGVLLYDWTAGGHSRTPTQNSMMRLAQRYGFRLDRSDQQAYITPATLQGIDLIVFNNSDQDPLQNPVSLAAVRDFVENQGKGILVIHAGGAYIPCPGEDIADPACRWLMRGLRTQFWIQNLDNTRATIYADSVKAGEIPPRATGISAVPSRFNHGRMHPETKWIFDDLPTNAGSGPLANQPFIWEGLGDEWYNYRNNPRLEGERVIDGVAYGPVNILLSLDESSIADNSGCGGGNCKNIGTFGDRPASWTRKVGKGKVAYQNAGHSDVYTRSRLVGGVQVKDSLIEKFNWRLMKYLAGDFEIPTGIQGPKVGDAKSGLVVSQGVLKVPLEGKGRHRVEVVDLQGRRVHAGTHQGPGPLVLSGLRTGLYVVKVRSATEKLVREKVHKFAVRPL